MNLNGLKEEYCFNEIAPKDNKMCPDVVSKSFVDLCFRDLEDETFSQHQFP